MKKFYFILPFIFGLLSIVPAKAQNQNFNLVGGMGATFLNRPAKFLFNVEGQFGLSKIATFTAGFQSWEQKSQATFGVRLYPTDGLFFRARGLFWSSADVALGGGFQKSLDNRWLAEISTDYYMNADRLGVQLGIGYRF
ncbi:hypothetical protein [Persicobacter psychrovividus]|uniref:Outer membrane protein beta-barrel domain-containing protein n=1 Tax=Persicobacter psychrovividus TaxID=387638 RepID=A0ABM7VA00_9BACT|nr:hypothetical protein PEPS_00340 [Persicobacter psychrovividus]